MGSADDAQPRIVRFSETPNLPDGIREVIIEIETADGTLMIKASYDGSGNSVSIQKLYNGDTRGGRRSQPE